MKEKGCKILTRAVIMTSGSAKLNKLCWGWVL